MTEMGGTTATEIATIFCSEVQEVNSYCIPVIIYVQSVHPATANQLMAYSPLAFITISTGNRTPRAITKFQPLTLLI